MQVHMETSERLVTAYLTGEIDHHGAGGIRETIDEAAQRIKPETLRLDFTGVTFMDSSGIGLVMGRYRLMNELNGKLEVVGASPQIARVLRLAGVDRLRVLKRRGE